MALMLFCVCHAEDITIHFSGTTAKVKNSAKDSVKVKVKGANVKIESQYKSHKLTLLLTGKSNDGQLMLKTAGKAKVKLEDLTLTSQEGALPPAKIRPIIRLQLSGLRINCCFLVRAHSTSLLLAMAAGASRARRISLSRS